MVNLPRMAVDLFDMARRTAQGEPPLWAQELFDSVRSLHQKVNLIMAVDQTVINRILVGAQFLADRDKANQAKIAQLTQDKTDLQNQLGQEQAAEAAEDAQEQAANDAAAKVADEIDALVKGPDTPDVQVPTDPGQVVDVVTGATDPVVSGDAPDAGAAGSGDSVNAD